MATSGTDAETPSGVDVPRIVKTDDVLGGDPRIDGTRVGVFHVYPRYVDGDDEPETIADGLDVSVAEVHAALAYAFHNPEEMRAIEERDPAVPGRRVTPDDEQ